MAMDFDLFGNPVSVNDGKRGRPEHEVTEENIIFVMVLLASGHSNKDVAKTLGLSVPTFRKHYLHLIRQREVLADRLRTKLRVTQIQQGLAGNASALNAALNTLEKLRVEDAERKVDQRGGDRPGKAQPKLGKKQERQAAADAVDGKYAPPAPPMLVVNNNT